MTTCSIPVALLMNHCKRDQQNAASKLDDPNTQRYVQEGENEHIQDADQGNEENGGCNDTDNQVAIPSPHSPNTNGDLPGDCTQNNRVTGKTHFSLQASVQERGGGGS